MANICLKWNIVYPITILAFLILFPFVLFWCSLLYSKYKLTNSDVCKNKNVLFNQCMLQGFFLSKNYMPIWVLFCDIIPVFQTRHFIFLLKNMLLWWLSLKLFTCLMSTQHALKIS